MENENENTNSENVENQNQDLESMDTAALKELVVSGRGDKLELEGKNKQLFERAKTAEGFEKDEDGSWVKIIKETTVEKKPKVKKTEEKPDESALLQKFDKLALKTDGIVEEDEIELAHKLKEETGKEMEDLLKSKYFKAELETLREEKANTKATSDVRGGGGEAKVKETPEYWIKKGGYPTADEVPDKKLRAKIARAMMKNTKSGKKFYND